MGKQKYTGTAPIAVYSMGLAGIKILGIENGINDYIIVRDTDNRLHRLKIYSNTAGDKDYFRLHGRRIYLDECIRVEV